MPERRIRILRWNARVHGLKAARLRLMSIGAEGRRAMTADKEMTAGKITIVHRIMIGRKIRIIMIVAGLRIETVSKPFTTLRRTCGKVRLPVATGETSPDAIIPAAMQTTGMAIEATLFTRIRALRKCSVLLRRTCGKVRLPVATGETSPDATIRAAMPTTAMAIEEGAMRVDRRKTGILW